MRFLKNLLKRWLLTTGTSLSRPPGQFDLTFYKLLAMKRRGLHVSFAVDGGAAEGDWALRLLDVFPEARVLCIEPRPDAYLRLQAHSRTRAGIKAVRSLLGKDPGTEQLFIAGHQSSVFSNPDGTPVGAAQIVARRTLDEIVRSIGTCWPELVKLDLQGAELMALQGASRCLEHLDALILEVSFLPVYRDAPLVDDICAFVRESGMRLADVLSLSHRPIDGAVTQGDLLFLRATHSLFAVQGWSQHGSI